MVNSLSFWWRLPITILVFALFAAIMVVINNTLFDTSMKIIGDISESWNDSFTSFLRYFTNIGLVTIIVIAACYVFLIESKIAQVMFLNAVMFSWMVAAFLKNGINEIRPYWKEEKLLIKKPEIDYGNPSGHSLFAISVGFSFLLIYCMSNTDFYLTDFELDLATKRKSGLLYAPSIKVLIGVVTLFLCTLIVYSRVHVAAHSINQVIHGSTLAILCTSTIFFSFRPELVALYKSILIGDSESSTHRNVIICFLLTVLGILAQFVLYLILTANNVKLAEEIVGRIKRFVENFTSTTPLESGLSNGCIGAFIIGLHAGLVFSSYVLKINAVRCSLPILILKRIGRLILVLLLAGAVLAVPYFLIPLKPIMGFVWIKVILPSILSGFILYGLGDYVALKIGWLPEVPNEELTLRTVKVETQ
eukprot:TRINITY_DN2306_c0_g1_i5.p1 TRINITY_DN2306_c0_g1~~TRINITY_DN2306_c0_g1_i5.p1  ORF type:complete len:419 (+),score=85.96 TRINITY_DN2306_c0_g1_i5:68-1324(+)